MNYFKPPYILHGQTKNKSIPKKKQNKTKTRTNSQEQAILRKKKYFMAGTTQNFLSANRPIRYFWWEESPIDQFKMSAVWPSITEGFPTTHSNYPQIIMIQIPCKHLPAVSLTLSTYHIRENCPHLILKISKLLKNLPLIMIAEFKT